ncbi:hypothetical protein [Flavobacterium sp.]|uniref:hypothetical protein n=1 Tax=Flavobacterium sp. TaxID=239 RepID=UPI0025C238F0|nr:hypothetical protein [Flavobacterium sp.]
MRTTIYCLITLISILIILICIDLSTGIWYWNKLNLKFDSSEFNNVVTPLLTMVATPIYAWALYTTIKQNKITLSQNLKPFYEKEIDNLVLKGKKIKFEDSKLFGKKKINALNFVKYISKCFVNLSLNEQYREDYENYKKGKKFTKDYFFSRNYIDELMFISNFTMGIGGIFFFHSDISSLINKIKVSKLIKEDKDLLKTRIYSEFLAQYMAFIEIDIKHNIAPKFPDIYPSQKLAEIEFKKLSETGLNVTYKSLKKEYKAIT